MFGLCVFPVAFQWLLRWQLRRAVKRALSAKPVLIRERTAWNALAAEPVPVVGCPAESMSGPLPAPATPPIRARVAAAGAGQLALYAAEGQQVLVPRGWHCIELYGSGGAVLLVTPHFYTAAILPGANRLSGPRSNYRC